MVTTGTVAPESEHDAPITAGGDAPANATKFAVAGVALLFAPAMIASPQCRSGSP